MKIKNIEAFGGVLFSVQASMLSITIAIIALLTNFIQKNFYGMSVSRYIMFERPYIFKHYRIILFSLGIIILNYLAISKGLYNCITSLLVASVILLILMLQDVVETFTSNKIAKEIKEFIISNRENNELIESFRNELIEAAETNNYIMAKRDCEFLLQLFNSSKYNYLFTEKLENILSEFIRITYKIKNENLYLLVIDTVLEFYKSANADQENIVYLNIWDNSEELILNIISALSYGTIMESKLLSLHSYLYGNLQIEDSDNLKQRKNGYELHYFSSRIYSFLFVYKQCDFLEMQKENIKDQLLSNISFIFYYKYANEYKKDIANIEMKYYLKTLIDNNDITTFITTIENQFLFLEENKDIILQIIIYIYYLAYKETDFPYNKIKLKENAIKLFETAYKTFSSFTWNYFNNEFIKNVDSFDYKKSLLSWEIIKFNKVKTMIMPDIIREFFVLEALYYSWNNNILESYLKKLIGQYEKIYEFYDQFICKSDFNNYFKFVKNILNPGYTIEQAENKYNDLKSILTNIYKIYEIENSNRCIVNEKSIVDFNSSLRTITTNEIQKVFGNFNTHKIEATNDSKLPHDLIKGMFPNLSINKYSLELLKDNISMRLVVLLLYLIHDHMNVKEIDRDEKSKLAKFFGSFNEANMDMVIGDGEVFYGDPGLERYREFLKGKIHLERSIDYMSLYALNSCCVQILIEDINLVLRDCQDEEILQWGGAKLCEDGSYQYNVANDIFLTFSKEEFIDYIKKTHKYLYVSIMVDCRIENPIIGGGIKTQKKNKSDS